MNKIMIKEFLILELKTVAAALPFILAFSAANQYFELGIPLIGHFGFGILVALPFALLFAGQTQ